ncbi:MAG: cytochrome c4 [Gammaproteobacteria bacterium]|nr:cytochrome c4 [Gammaproteobacteria bacterium]
MGYTTLSKALLVAGLALGVSYAVSAAEKPKLMMGASAEMLASSCFGCHGKEVSAGPASPTISGISDEYFTEVMAGFASGEVPSTIMGRIAKGYTKDEIKSLSKYYGALKFVKVKQDFDAKLAKKGKKLHNKYCEKCHAEGGTSAEDDAGILAGQWTQFVQWTLDDYRSGAREMTKKMKKKMAKLEKKEGEAGFTALFNYYASQH